MTDEEARVWLEARFSNQQMGKLEQFVALLRSEAEQQSLIARSTFDKVWSRHIVDSAQLLRSASDTGAWLDVGSGAGLPGLVIAILREAPVTLCEPRRKRVDFLETAVSDLGLSNAFIFSGKAQDLARPFQLVTARAVSSISDIFTWTTASVSRETLYLLQRGQSWREDVALAQHTWHGAFHVEQSITDPQAGIVIAQNVRPR